MINYVTAGPQDNPTGLLLLAMDEVCYKACKPLGKFIFNGAFCTSMRLTRHNPHLQRIQSYFPRPSHLSKPPRPTFLIPQVFPLPHHPAPILFPVNTRIYQQCSSDPHVGISDQIGHLVIVVVSRSLSRR